MDKPVSDHYSLGHKTLWLITNRSIVLNRLGRAGQVEPVLGGKANLDYIKPHSFTFELLT